MKQFSRDFWLAIALLGVLVLVTMVAVLQQKVEPPLSSTSSAPDGARALKLALAELGYKDKWDDSADPSSIFMTSVGFMLEPFPDITQNDWEGVDYTVNAGGTLILAGDNYGTALAVRHYQFDLAPLPNPVTPLTSQTPLFTSPPVGPA